MNEKEQATAATLIAGELAKEFNAGRLTTFDGQLKRNKVLGTAFALIQACDMEGGNGDFTRFLNRRMAAKPAVPADFAETDGTF
jgi:hypothetical protein